MPTIHEHVKNCSCSAADTEQLDTGGAHYSIQPFGGWILPPPSHYLVLLKVERGTHT